MYALSSVSCAVLFIPVDLISQKVYALCFYNYTQLYKWLNHYDEKLLGQDKKLK